jgi:uncharacterized Zn finger protein
MADLRFDADAVRARLDPNRIRRGEFYFSNGQIELLALAGGRALAVATGETGARYAVEVAADGRGRCDCPDFPVEHVCKHILAVALAADDLSGEAARRLSGRLHRLAELLTLEGPEALAERLLRLEAKAPGLLQAIEGAEAG